jgi:dTDP-4-dehydrorhamnose reductase
VLVLGANGMLGHKLLQHLRLCCDVAGTLRAEAVDPALENALRDIKLYPKTDARSLRSVCEAIDDWDASVVINCIGIIKQIKAANDPIESISINALFPHQLARLTETRGVRLIHFSTDCVFSGTRGNYTEDDQPDPVDLYGRTKLLGEVIASDVLTLRTSIIGQELRGHHGLLDWFLSQRGGRVQGFANARYSGLTTRTLGKLIVELIRNEPRLNGVWHVSSDPISKFDLLRIVNQVYDLKVDLSPDESFVCDRTLDSTRFRKRIGWRPPSWDEMIVAMHAEAGIYA